jgi:type II secretion system (T2SS) protein C
MPRRLLVLNAVLTILCAAFAVGIVRTLLAKHPLPAPAAQRAAATPQPTATTQAADPGPEAFAIIAARNLFNPGRSETAAAAVSVAKPILYGVVIDGAHSRAFLEDPTAKRVAGYSVGDTMGGGKIQKIADDRVVIARPEGLIEVLLQDPSKPRPAPAATAVPAKAAAPGQPAPSQVAPGQVVSPVPGPPATQPPSTVPQFRGRPAPQATPANDQ